MKGSQVIQHAGKPHDGFFRAAMTHCHVAQEFFDQYFPGEKNHLDFSTLQVCQAQHVSNRLK